MAVWICKLWVDGSCVSVWVDVVVVCAGAGVAIVIVGVMLGKS